MNEGWQLAATHLEISLSLSLKFYFHINLYIKWIKFRVFSFSAFLFHLVFMVLVVSDMYVRMYLLFEKIFQISVAMSLA